jgi:site-specific recombinase XerD
MDTRSNEQWLLAFAAHLARRFPGRSTAKHYLSDLQLFVHLHPQPLAEVGRSQIDAFVQQQYERGLSPASVKRRVAALKSFFDFMADELDQPERPNPVSMRRHVGRLPRLLPRDLSDAEVNSFLAVVDNLRDRAIFLLMLYAGLRVGEVVSLQLRDVTIPSDAQAALQLRVLGKGRKERLVYLAREQAAALLEYLQTAPPASPASPLFRTRFEAGFSVAGIQERVSHYAAKCGLELSAHRLRHTYARWLAEGHMPLLQLSRLLGHASPQTTQRYIDGADPELRHSYQAAISRLQAPASAEPVKLPELAPAKSEPASVVRALPSEFDTSYWMPEAPAWLREPCLSWVATQWPRWKGSQRQHHAGARLRQLRLLWRWRLQHGPISSWDELSSADIAAYIDAELGRGIAAKSVKGTLDCLYQVLRWLQEQGQLERLPARPELKLPASLPRHLQPGEVLALEAVLQQQAVSGVAGAALNQALYYLLSHGGLRVSEALDLQVGDLDLPAGRVRVREGKGRRDRVVYLSSKGVAVLAEYLRSVPHAPGDLVLSRAGKPLRYEEAWRRIKELGEAAGVAQVSPHRLRHTYATVLLNNGVSIEGLRRLMGHENISTTLIYAHLADTMLEQQYNAAMARVTHSSANSM